ncbi:zinc finger protein VAR3, chloroplastic [Andrographis paniculata]|uniref:zinc finger protein VAR3, chloroplastic n=1 Tax=Andrographis paniculata TaxID=175694 RepID=UPI0021E8C722|nr:zinc finger protein VAR3, chloroplastic [Andrographis paniculata]
MGGATRLITLLAVPFPPLRPSLRHFRVCVSTISSSSIRSLSFSSNCKAKSRGFLLVKSFHSQPNNYSYGLESSAAQKQHQSVHPWPEWCNFLQIVSNRQDSYGPEVVEIPPEDAFLVYEQLPDDFVRAAASCLSFARARPNLLGLLSRRDIEAVVSNGTPFLFKSALDTARRMRSFVESDGNNVSGISIGNTVDLMKYILSYASNPTVSSERNGLYSRELVDSSVRNLLHELSAISHGASAGYMGTSQHHQAQGGQGAVPPYGQNIVMKRGDWICPKCKFMNFARNMKCLECEGPRPKKQLTGGEWECPQCNFFNYGRNTVCLRCDSRKPGAPLFNATNVRSGFEYNGESNYRTSLENTTANQSPNLVENSQFPSNPASNEEAQAEKPEPQKWFKKMVELHESKDSAKEIADDNFPAMPMRKGENQFVVSKNENRSLSSPKYKRQAAMDQVSNTNFVPFVPFPPGYFARKDSETPHSPEPPPPPPTEKSGQQMRAANSQPLDEIGGSQEGRQTRPSLEGSGVTEPDPLDMSEEAKAERWFKRVAQIKDISELSEIPDEDFPSIMPMRKGVNRFVVSKRKTPLERRLTSQQHRRNLPIERTDPPLKREGNNS